MSQIVYVGHDGAIHTANPDGTGGRALTPPGAEATWPAWAPDGASITFSSVRSGSNGGGFLAVYLKALDDTPPTLVYANQPGTDAIAQRTPHYALWSPDSRKLAFIAQAWRGGLTLFLHDTGGAGQAQPLVSRGPMYMSWSSDSRYLLVHANRSHHLMDLQRAGQRGGQRGAEMRQMPGEASLYMAPSWCPGVNRMAICRDVGGGRQRLLIADTRDGRVRTVTELTGNAAFAWSPDGKRIGLLRDAEDQPGYYTGLWLVDADTSGEERVTEDPVLCFFWSPDGRRIAYITTSGGAEGSVRWAMIDVEGGAIRHLVDFRPTQEQLITFMFFDQYAQSHSLWSPDSRHLIFSGVLGAQSARAPLPGEGVAGVFVLDVEGSEAPRQVAQGFLGFWSRR